MEKAKNETVCITPEFRVSYPAVFKARAYDEDKDPKFSIKMLFSKKADLSALKKAADAARTAKYGKDKSKWPKVKYPLLSDGDEKADQEGYENTWVATAASKTRPAVVDRDRKPITEEDNTFYPGCFARAKVNAYVWENKFGKGVSFGLVSVQKTKDGPRLGNSISSDPENDFDELPDDGSNNEDNYESAEAEENDGGF